MKHQERFPSLSRNLRLEGCQPQIHPGNLALPCGTKGRRDDYGVKFSDCVIKDQGKLRMWYGSLDEDLKKWPKVNTTIGRPADAESTDGIQGMKPGLGLVEHHGSAQKTPVKARSAPSGTIILKVARDDEDPAPSRRSAMAAQIAVSAL